MQPPPHQSYETLYNKKLVEILRKHRGLLQSSQSSTSTVTTSEDQRGEDQRGRDVFAAENALLDRVMRNERSNILSSLALAGLVFGTVRYGPRFAVIKIGGEAKRLALQRADELAEKANTRLIQKTTAFMFESLFATWAGWRGYSILSQQNANSYEEIAKIPLVPGRSVLSDRLCDDFINLSHREIPPDFWSNLDLGEDSGLKDRKRWQAVRDFGNNCAIRRSYEASFRRDHGLKSDASVEIPRDALAKTV